jgi:hypothetical protein
MEDDERPNQYCRNPEYLSGHQRPEPDAWAGIPGRHHGFYKYGCDFGFQQHNRITQHHQRFWRDIQGGSVFDMKIKGKKVPNQIGGILSKKPWKGYVRGGSIGDELYDPSHGGTMPRALQYPLPEPPKTWTRPPRYAEGGEVDPLELGLANPSFAERWYDRAAGAYAAPKPSRDLSMAMSQRTGQLPDVGEAPIGNGGTFSEGSPNVNTAANIGSQHGYNAMHGAATLPGRYIKAVVDASKMPAGSEEAREGYGDVGSATGELALSMLGPKGGASQSTHGVFVGPYGAMALRNKAREAGDLTAERAMVHPVVAKELKKEADRLPAAQRDRFLSDMQSSRDDWARATLEARAAKGNFKDRDVFAKSGWSFTADGKPAKEISDIGASVKPISGLSNKYSLEHPAGDLHKVYDMPPISKDPTAKNEAYLRYNNGSPIIGVGGDPTKKTDSVIHEVQHLISAREGWPRGGNPDRVSDAIKSRELFSGEKLPQYQKEMFIKADPKVAKAKNLHDLTSNPTTAALAGYLHSAGENQAFNTMARRKKSFNYLMHPEDTEIVPRALQEIEYFPSKKADGGEVNAPWFTKASARMPSSGMLKSSIPGRTDKIPMSVPGGSYVLPADIPSALGQGNTMAGGTILDKMFQKGPYGMNLPKAKAGQSTKMSRMSSLTKTRVKTGYAEGGDVQSTPIIAAGGEYVLDPDQVAQVGGGDLTRGHEILDQFVKQVRQQHIQTLRKLPGPKRD